MWNLLKSKTSCERFRNALEQGTTDTVAADFREHLAGCADCRAYADDLAASRALLAALPAQPHEPSPWFASRVMSAITARENDFRRSLETWVIVPRLAAKLTWVSALMLLLAGTWLYQHPRTTAPNQNTTESIFESAPTAPHQDDVLVNPVEPRS